MIVMIKLCLIYCFVLTHGKDKGRSLRSHHWDRWGNRCLTGGASCVWNVHRHSWCSEWKLQLLNTNQKKNNTDIWSAVHIDQYPLSAHCWLRGRGTTPLQQTLQLRTETQYLEPRYLSQRDAAGLKPDPDWCKDKLGDHVINKSTSRVCSRSPNLPLIYNVVTLN